MADAAPRALFRAAPGYRRAATCVERPGRPDARSGGYRSALRRAQAATGGHAGARSAVRDDRAAVFAEADGRRSSDPRGRGLAASHADSQRELPGRLARLDADASQDAARYFAWAALRSILHGDQRGGRRRRRLSGKPAAGAARARHRQARRAIRLRRAECERLYAEPAQVIGGLAQGQELPRLVVRGNRLAGPFHVDAEPLNVFVLASRKARRHTPLNGPRTPCYRRLFQFTGSSIVYLVP